MENKRLLGISLIALCAICLAACSAPRAKTTLHETRLIQPSDGIAIFWDVGTFTRSPDVQSALRENGAYSKRFEVCTSEFLATTFSRNGYKVTVERSRPMAIFNRSSSDAKYILVLNNTSASFSSSGPAAATIGLTIDGTLFDRASGKSLISLKYPMSPKADDNGGLVIQLVRGLAAEGFLNVPVDKVADFDGVVSQSFRRTSPCSVAPV